MSVISKQNYTSEFKKNAVKRVDGGESIEAVRNNLHLDENVLERWLARRDLREHLLLIALTLTYLFFELSFNAWLLNTVGGGAPEAEVSRLEFYGRTLTGIAVALVAFQLLLPRMRNQKKLLVILCGMVVFATYSGLKSFVDTQLIETSTQSERKQFYNLLLLQSALVTGKADIKGLEDDGALFKSPEGKSFLAIFPYFVSAIDDLDKKIFDSKLEIIKRSIEEKIGLQNYYDQYKKAIEATNAKWKKYRQAGDFDLEGEIARQQEKAWSDYTRDLAKHRWTPETVPVNIKVR